MFGYQNRPYKLAPNRPGGLACTFDGGYSSHLAAARVLERYGGLGTFFLNYISIGADGTMSANDITTLYNKGHEIGCYGSDGTNLTTLTESEADTYLRTAQSTIKAWLGGITPRSCAYPLGGGNLREHCLASRYYDRVRKNVWRWQSIGNTFIVWVPMSLTHETINDIKDMIVQCAQRGESLALTIHRTDDSDYATSITLSELESIVKLAYKLRMPLTTLSNLTTNYNMMRDPWWEHIPNAIDSGCGWAIQNNTGITINITEGAGPWGGNACVFSAATSTSAFCQIYQHIPIDPRDTQYTLCIPYKIEGLTSGGFNVAILYYNGENTYLSANQVDYTANTDGWVLHKQTYTIPSNTRALRIRVSETSNTNTDAVISIGRIMLYPAWAGDYGANPS
jgi:peptidoglycan/xylan/chitin deacetylase (PgdA/CDA1 family)